ncbi:MAG: hypothetical protein JW801_05070 [Bacteroidales bacterium]|nr:hypothetical protein [Bacteroidales bacterium]
MEQAHQYIQRLLAFALCLVAYFLSADLIQAYLSVPVLVLAFSLLNSRITGDKPPHLFAYYRTDEYFKRGGLRDLIRILVTFLGFVYDVGIWTVWGVYLIFLLFTDLIFFLKTIFFWLIHALIWFLRQYVPFLLFLYRIFLHYLVRWPWWLYQTAYNNIRFAFHKNSLRIAFRGSFLALLTVFIFYYLELLVTDIPGITIIGLILSLLPLSWSFGELASLRAKKREDEPFSDVRKNFQNGIETVRSMIFYVTLFVVLLLIQLGLNLTGWIPNSGVPVAGILFNLNTLISLLLFILCLLIVAGVILIPSFRIYNPFNETRMSDSGLLLTFIFRKFLQYLVVSIPNMIFSGLIIIIPVLVVMLAGGFTYKLKNFTADIRIEQLKTAQESSKDKIKVYELGKKIDHLESLKSFPRGVSQELMHREILKTELQYNEEDLKIAKKELLEFNTGTETSLEFLKSEIEQRRMQDSLDTEIPELQLDLRNLQASIKATQSSKETEIARLEADVDFLRMRVHQIPMMFLFGGLWLVLFGSIILSFILSYLGHVYHQVFIFRNDDSPSEWTTQARSIREQDTKQPLLGGTLFFLTLLIIYLLWSEWTILSDYFDPIDRFREF